MVGETIVNSQWFRRIELQQLMNLTARAFGVAPIRLWPLPCDEALRVYAAFTRNNLQQGVDRRLLQRMGEEACKMGRLLRLGFCVRHQTDVEQLTTALYRHIGIQLEGHIPGELCFRRCFFSQYYTPETCLAASALDEGIMRGLTGNGKLTFQQRITEGCACCKAVFNKTSNTNNETDK